jgi:hypothetical protein
MKQASAIGVSPMPTTLKNAATKYLRTGKASKGTQDEYNTTLNNWREWGGGVPIEKIDRKGIRDFLDWVYNQAVTNEGSNPGRTVNKARENLRAIMSWADTMGAGYFYDGFNRGFKTLLSADPAFDIQDVQGVELYYNAAITPWFHLTTDLQVIDNENVGDDTAIIFGLRGKIEF